MERLTAFEFIAAQDGPQLVRLKRKDVVLIQFGVVSWVGVDLQAIKIAFDFDACDDLTIEGAGIGRPYWNGQPPSWSVLFDPVAEQRRIETIRGAARRELNRASLSVMS